MPHDLNLFRSEDWMLVTPMTAFLLVGILAALTCLVILTMLLLKRNRQGGWLILSCALPLMIVTLWAYYVSLSFSLAVLLSPPDMATMERRREHIPTPGEMTRLELPPLEGDAQDADAPVYYDYVYLEDPASMEAMRTVGMTLSGIPLTGFGPGLLGLWIGLWLCRKKRCPA